MAISLSDQSEPVPVYVSTPVSPSALMAADPPATSSDRIAQALRYLCSAEETETCPYCRSHITATRVLVEDLLRVGRMGEDLRKHPEMAQLAVRISELGESMGALSLVARVIHRMKGLR